MLNFFMNKQKNGISWLLAMVFCLLSNSAIAINSADISDLIKAFEKRESPFLKDVDNLKNASSNHIDAYARYMKFLDKELNKAYKTTRSKLSAKQQLELKESQINWLKFRDTEFALIKNTWNQKDYGGSAEISQSRHRCTIVRDRVLHLLYYAMANTNQDDQFSNSAKVSKDCSRDHDYCEGYITPYKIKDNSVADYSWDEKKYERGDNILTLNIHYKNGDLVIIEHTYLYKSFYKINISYNIVKNHPKKPDDAQVSQFLARLYQEHVPKTQYKIKFRPSFEKFILNDLEKNPDEKFMHEYNVHNKKSSIVIEIDKKDISNTSEVFSTLYSLTAHF
ncbi:MAG: DUF1311 domain-containing protein [Gammaproteobacteria bacterium]|nr:MAG: DUF1311 domain-containing protein [Gammaproteobacteria bacterium]